jgi:hypothetical protein
MTFRPPFTHLDILSHHHGTQGEAGITVDYVLACLVARALIS